MAFNSLSGIQAGLHPLSVHHNFPFNSLSGILEGRVAAFIAPGIYAFNSLSGIHNLEEKLAEDDSRYIRFQLPFRDSAQALASTFDFFTFNSLSGILLIEDMKKVSQLTFNSLSGIHQAGAKEEPASYSLSTPFPGFKLIDAVRNDTPPKDFQLPFRDSSKLTVPIFASFPSFNSLSGIRGGVMRGHLDAETFQLPFRDSVLERFIEMCNQCLSTPFPGF